MSTNNIARFLLLGAAAVAGCAEVGSLDEHTSTAPEQEALLETVVESPSLTLGEFSGYYDADTQQFHVEMVEPSELVENAMRTTQQALGFCNDFFINVHGIGLGLNTVLGSVYDTAADCIDSDQYDAYRGLFFDEGGAFCATVRVDSRMENTLYNLAAEITSITSGYEGYNYFSEVGDCCGTGADPDAFVGLNAPSNAGGGLFLHAEELNDGEFADQQWTFRNAGGSFEFSGRIVGQVEELENGLDDDCDGQLDNALNLYADDTECREHVDCISGRCTDIDVETEYGDCATTCDPGSYGLSCEPCPDCGPGTCSDGAIGDGTCACPEGFAGFLCDACEPGRYGASCELCGDCGSGTCNEGIESDGSCFCPAEVHGTACEFTCSDSVQNGDEEGVDCGGSACGPCGPTSALDGCSAHVFEGHTYHFCPTPATVTDAREICASAGYTLVSIDSAGENSFVSSVKGPGNVIIGINDINSEGSFVWTNGSDVTYTRWNAGEPNNSGGNEDCTVMFGHGIWNDYNCTPQPFMCESQATAPQQCQEVLDNEDSYGDGHYLIDPDGAGGDDPMAAYCDMTTDGGGWTMVLNYVHQAGTNPPLDARTDSLPLMGTGSLGDDESGTDTWGHAGPALFSTLGTDTEIRFDGVSSGHTRRMNFKTDNQSCVDHFAGNGGNCRSLVGDFTGLTGHNSFLPALNNDGYFHGPAGEEMTFFPFFRASAYHWGVGAAGRWEVDDFAGNSAHTIHRIWTRGNTTTYAATIPGCTPHTYDGRTFQVCGTMSWVAGQAHCAGSGYHMVSISSAAENAFVAGITPSVAWLGINDRASEGTWAQDGGDPFVFSNWRPGEPNNAGNEDCAEIYSAGFGGGWNDHQCHLGRTIICESP